MFDLFELLVEGLAKLAVMACSWAVSLFTNAFYYDLGYFSQRLPLVAKSYEIFQTMALGLVMLFFLWQCLKAIGAPITVESEDLVKVFFKSILAVFCIYNAQGILNEGFNVLRPIYDMISGLDPAATTLTWSGDYSVVDGMLDTSLLFTGLPLVQIIVFAVLLIIVLWNLLKMLIELTERYILLGILTVTSPLGFSTMTTKSTSNIFAAWMRMIIGQFIVYLLNFWIIKIFLNAFSGMPPLTDPGEAALWFVFMWALLKVALKLDTFLGKLGIEVGNVGGSLLEEIMLGKLAFNGISKVTGFGGKNGKAGGGLASALSAMTGGKGGGSPIASALANGTPVGGVVGRAAMGVLGKVTKGAPLGGLLTYGNPLRGVGEAAKAGTNSVDKIKRGAKHLGANVANAVVPGVTVNKAAKVAKMLNENPVLGGGEKFNKKLQNLTKQNGVTPNLINSLNREVGGERGVQIASGLMAGKTFGDLTPEMVKSPFFEATAYQGGVRWSYTDFDKSAQYEGYMAIKGDNKAAKEALKFKNNNQNAYHYTSSTAGGRKIDCVYKKSVILSAKE